MAAGIPKIRITFSIDIDGILSVFAEELRSGLEQKITVHSTYGIDEDEMGKMLLDSIEHAEADMHIKALTESRVEAEGIVRSTNKFIDQNKSWLTLEQVNDINNLANQLKKSISATDKNDIVKAMDSLNEFTKPLAQFAMEHAIKTALSGKEI